jgi:Ohr subfamily peroxiredoxin
MPTTSYTAVVTTVGEGRHGGRSTTDDGNLDVVHAYPVELGGNGAGTNPEQLLGAGWSACFRGALGKAAADRSIKLGNTEVVAEVTVTADNGDHSLSAVLKASASEVDTPTLQSLMEVAHTLCPYSKATAGNMPVELVAL